MGIEFYLLLLIIFILLVFVILFYKIQNSRNISNTMTEIEKAKIEFEEQNKYLLANNQKSIDEINENKATILKLTDEKSELTIENNLLQQQLAKEQATVVQLKEQIKTQENLLEIAKKEFSSIAIETLSEKQKDLSEKNKNEVQIALEPLNQKLKDFKDEIVKYQKDHTENTGKLTQSLQTLQDNSIKLSQSAQNLSDALTQNRNVKGWYGEDLAKIILEKSGLKEGIHFISQADECTTTQDNETKNVRPDFEILLPDNRNLVIDSKAILSSIVEMDSDDEQTEKKIFDAVKIRTDELKKKKYENIKGLRQPDFIIMYIPVEPIVNLLYTTKNGMEIIETARQNNIVITGSVSLVTIINLIEKIWQENDRIKNLDKIIDTGAKLYEAVAKHAEEILEIKKYIDNAKDKTDETLKRLVESSNARINIFKEAEKLKNYGISSTKIIAEKLLENEDVQELEILK